jgi:peptidoglycan hydrolase-like protein with peptidoglycan-binding domain
MNKKKVLIVLGGLIGVTAAIFFIFKNDESKFGQFIRRITGIAEPPKDDTKVGGGKSTDIGGGKSTDNGSSPINNVLNPSDKTYPCSYKSESFPIKANMKGEKSKAIQLALNKVYNQKLTVDGCFGPNSQKAVQAVLGKDSVSQADYAKLIAAYAGVSSFNPF